MKSIKLKVSSWVGVIAFTLCLFAITSQVNSATCQLGLSDKVCADEIVNYSDGTSGLTKVCVYPLPGETWPQCTGEVDPT